MTIKDNIQRVVLDCFSLSFVVLIYQTIKDNQKIKCSCTFNQLTRFIPPIAGAVAPFGSLNEGQKRAGPY